MPLHRNDRTDRHELALSQLPQLPHLRPRLSETPAVRQVAALIDSARLPLLACPRCHARNPYRNGRANGLQRFRCRACRRTFNALTGTPLARLRHKDKWLPFCETLLDPAATVRRAAGHAAVHRNTSFRWRHRMLALTKLDRQLPLRGVVEIDEWHLRESHKGERRPQRPPHKGLGLPGAKASTGLICVLIARDRDGRTHDAVTGPGALTEADLHQHLKRVLHADALLVVPSYEPYREFCASAGVPWAMPGVSGAAPPQPELHVDNVGGYHSRLRAWLRHFRGVATRYLDNYCGWRWALDGQRVARPAALLRCALGCFPSQR